MENEQTYNKNLNNASEENYRQANNALLDKLRRDKERREEQSEAAEASLKNFFKKAVENDDVKRNIKIDMTGQMEGRNTNQLPPIKRQAGFNTVNESFGNIDNIPTGFEKKYWEDESDDSENQ